MSTQVERPMVVSEDHLIYLDNLRESGVTNMWGAGEYVEDHFDTDEDHAKEILLYWMKSFEERHPD